MSYDSLDNHLPEAGSIERAAVVPGMYLAWCVNLGLLSQEFEAAHHALLMRVRYREVSGSELLVAGAAGDLKAEHFSSAGQAFTERYYPNYLQDVVDTFGPDIYEIEDNWANYDQIARVLTRQYMGPAAKKVQKSTAADTGKKHWWQVWR